MTIKSRSISNGMNQKKLKEQKNELQIESKSIYNGERELKLVQKSESGENLSGVLNRTNRFFSKLLNAKYLIFTKNNLSQIFLAFTVLQELDSKTLDSKLQTKLNLIKKQQQTIQNEIKLRHITY